MLFQALDHVMGTTDIVSAVALTLKNINVVHEGGVGEPEVHVIGGTLYLPDVVGTLSPMSYRESCWWSWSPDLSGEPSAFPM
jgi:hypothetical protein